MLHLFELLAALSASLFAGAALVINVAEHPARMELDVRAAVAQWRSSYKRASLMQAPLALISLASGAMAFFLGAGIGWLFACLLIGVVVPFTLLVIKPTNDALLTPHRDLGSAETRTLLDRWGKLHAVRTLLSLAATVLYLCLLLAA